MIHKKMMQFYLTLVCCLSISLSAARTHFPIPGHDYHPTGKIEACSTQAGGTGQCVTFNNERLEFCKGIISPAAVCLSNGNATQADAAAQDEQQFALDEFFLHRTPPIDVGRPCYEALQKEVCVVFFRE